MLATFFAGAAPCADAPAANSAPITSMTTNGSDHRIAFFKAPSSFASFAFPGACSSARKPPRFYYSSSALGQESFRGSGHGVFLKIRTSLVTRERRQVGLHVPPRYEDEARIGVRWRYEATAVLGEEELEQGHESLQIGLLVDG